MIEARPAHSLAALLAAALTVLVSPMGVAADAIDADDTPPLTLDTEVVVPPLRLPATETEAAVLVEVPPMVDGPAFFDALDEPATEVVPEVPSVAFEPAEPIAPPPITQLTITLDWYLNPQHAALLVAREKGLFQRRGLEVTLVSPADPNVPAKLLAAGRTDLALGRQPLLHLLVDEGMPLVRVATLIDTPLSSLVLREGPLEEKGKEAHGDDSASGTLPALRLGYTVQDSEALLGSPLGSANGLPEHIDLVDVNYAVLDAMHEGSLDGVVIHQRHLLPRQLADEGILTHTLPLEEHGLPIHDGLILMANRDRLASQRDAIRQLVAALEEATLWIHNHREAAWELMTAAEPALRDPTMREAWEEIYPRLAQSPAAVDQGRYARFERLLLDAGLIETSSPVERLAVDLGAPLP